MCCGVKERKFTPGPAADRDAPGSAGDPKETRGGRTPWICRDAPYLFSRVRRRIVDPETGEPTQIVTTAGEVSTFEGGINVGAEVSAVFESPRLE